MDNKIEGGYILVPRLWDESESANWTPLTRELWFWLLRNVHNRDRKSFSRGEGFFTIEKIREGLSWRSGYCKGTYSKSQIGRSLQKLQDEGALQKWKSTRGVRVKITNYDFYQNPENYEGDLW